MSYVYAGLGGTEADQVSQTGKSLVAAAAANVVPPGTKKYDYAVAAGNFIVDQGVKYLEKGLNTDAGRAVVSTNVAVGQVWDFIESAKKGELKADQDGVLKTVQMTEAIFGSLSSIAVATGNATAKRVMSEVSAWGAIGGTCAVAAVSSGPTMGFGMVACALGALAKLLDYIISPSEFNEDVTCPRSLYMPEGTLNQDGSFQPGQVAAQDVMRLSRVLRSYYDVRSYGTLAARLGADPILDGCDDLDPYNTGYCINQFQYLLQNSKESYPAAPTIRADGSITPIGKPLPSHNLRTILQLLDFEAPTAAAAFANGEAGLAALAGYRSGLEPGGRGLFRRFSWDHDVSQVVIANGAFFGRSAIAASGSPTTQVKIRNGGDVAPYTGVAGSGYATKIVTVNWLPFIRLDELLNYLAAIVLEEYRLGIGDQTANGLGVDRGKTPIRFLYVRTQDTQGEPEPGKSYSSYYWTNLYSVQRSGSVRDAMPGNIEAVREYAALRLMMAFSLVHQHWTWSERRSQRSSAMNPDLFQLPQEGGILDTPADPRQVIDGRLAARETPAGAAGTVSHANGLNGSDVYSIAPTPQIPSMQGQDVYRRAGTSPEFIQAQIVENRRLAEAMVKQIGPGLLSGIAAAPALQVGTAAFRQALVKGIESRTSMVTTKTAGERAFVVTPTAVSKFQAGQAALYQKQQTAAVQSSSGGGSVLALGAAALALLLLRR